MFFQSRFHFYSSSLESSLLKFFNLRLESSIFENIRNFLIWELESSISWNMTNFLFLELEISISWNITNFFGVDFFYFFEFGLKSAPSGPIIHYSLPTVLKFWQYFYQTLIALLESLFPLCCANCWKMLLLFLQSPSLNCPVFVDLISKSSRCV